MSGGSKKLIHEDGDVRYVDGHLLPSNSDRLRNGLSALNVPKA